MLVVPHPAGQITNRDCFDRIVAYGGAIARDVFKFSALLAFPIRDQQASPRDPILGVGVSNSIQIFCIFL
jgi:hypothetical protein